jgi:alanyl-tRNA synthetase
VGNLKEDLIASAEDVGGIKVILQHVEVPDAGGLKQLGFEIKKKIASLFMVLTAEINGKPQIAVVVSENLVNKKELHAGNIVRELAKHIKGGGGGQPFFATAGGSDVKGLPQVLTAARTYIPDAI